MAEETQFIKAPGPWSCRAQVFTIPLLVSADQVLDHPKLMYSPLEGSSFFASPEAGNPIGGAGAIMVVRYSDTPVGAYDELAIMPGRFESPVPVPHKTGNKTAREKGIRITRIYVSQKDTAWNGRINWNIPKHLARFVWTDLPGNAIRLQVFPSDETNSQRPFFQMAFRTVPWVPRFPASSSLMLRMLGIRPQLIHPPLPSGSGQQCQSSLPRRPEENEEGPGRHSDDNKNSTTGMAVETEAEDATATKADSCPELVGTRNWTKANVAASSWHSHVGWFDLSQATGPESGPDPELANVTFWPDGGRWRLGVRMDDASFRLSEGYKYQVE